jgi:subtilase family serine protease
MAAVEAAFGVREQLFRYRGLTLRGTIDNPKLPQKLSSIVRYIGGLDETDRLIRVASRPANAGDPGKWATAHGNAASAPGHTASASTATAAPPPTTSAAAAGTGAPAPSSSAASTAAAPPTQSGGSTPSSSPASTVHVAHERPSAPPGPGYATPGPCSTYWADRTATVTPQPAPYPAKLPWTPCGYTPAQIRAAYGVDKTPWDGSGITVGITDAFASPTIVHDVNAFSSHYGLPLLDNSNFKQLVVPGTVNFPENRFDPQGWFGEETLDVEWVHAMAPHANIVFAGGQNSTVPLDHALINLIDNRSADVITNSWGIYGEPQAPGQMKADEQAFEQAAAEGITVLFSSGDDGDVAALTGLAQGSWPATSPFVTAVGGTSLGVLDPSGAKLEWGWGTYFSSLNDSKMSADGSTVTGTGWDPWPPEFFYGSGGGISVHFAQPDYQKGVVPDSLATSTTTASGTNVSFPTPHRVIPDISLVGDPNTGVLVGETYSISGDPLIDQDCLPAPWAGQGYEYCERRLGGTSLSSPLMAGIVALVDQARHAAGKPNIGFLNPAIYRLGSASAAIHDVLPPTSPTAVLRNTGATGQQTTLRTINSAVTDDGTVIEGADSSLRTTPRWDDVTGLGTPWAPEFVTALTAAP